jgi:hypothetical protein
MNSHNAYVPLYRHRFSPRVCQWILCSLGIPRETLRQSVGSPLSSGVGRHVEVKGVTSMVGQDHEDI